MKIGILTQPLHNNYGGLLQNYALQQVLMGMGHEVQTVDWMAESSWFRRELSKAKYTLLRHLNKDVDKPRYKPTAKEFAVLSRNTKWFVERYLSVCPHHVDRQEEFRTVDSRVGFDAYAMEWKDMMEAGIIDPAKVTRTALQNAASIAGLLLTTECAITDIPEKNPAPAMPAGGDMGGMY